MDAKQFEKFLEVQKQMLEQMKMATTPVQLQSSTSNAILVPNFDPFDSNKEPYKNYIQRFQNYIEMKGISTNKEYCLKLLLNSIGTNTFNVITSLAAPKSPTELKYEELLALLITHLSPTKNVLVAQHRFLSKYQNDQQTIAEYIATLRAEIIECEFTSPCNCKISIADMFLRAQFIRGIRDCHIREQLLQSSTAKFDEIVAKALALEAAKSDARELADKAGPSTNISTDINKISNFKKSKRPAKHVNQNRINYQDLGISGLCFRCGRNNHQAKECRTDKGKLKCSSCNKTGHVSKVCIKGIIKTNSGSKVADKTVNQVQNIQDTNYGVYKIIDVYQNNFQNSNSERYYANITIEGKPVKFEVDSGSGFTFLPRKEFNELNINAQVNPTSLIFRSYTQNTFVPYGKVRVNVHFKGMSTVDELYIVPDDCAALVGRSWIRRLKINLNELDELDLGKKSNDIFYNHNGIEDIMREFKDVFEEKIGCVPNHKVSLKLRDNAKPIYTKERQVPYSLRERVDKELDSLESAGIISKISNSDWGSPLVVIPKTDGGVRLCVDYKVGVNQRLVNAHYPIRKTEHIFNSLRNAKYFCRLDLYKAYLHLPVDEPSSMVQTISTHRGTYRMHRLSFGIKTAPAEFNRIIDQILRDVPSTESYFDDIIVHGETFEECKSNLKCCLQQLQKFDLHLNVSKCLFFENKIEFLGHTIEHNKVQKSPSKIQAILQMPEPKSADDVRRFLGMVTYYSRFILNVSTITTPLRKLLYKNSKFKWSAECQNAFNKLKKEIASDRVLMPYNPELPLQLACDASPTGIAGVLSHLVQGEERPIAFTSRSLTKAEQNYSQLDREALAIFYAIQRFHEYLFGRQFNLVTDNQPLVRIFHQSNKLPQMTSARLQRYAAFLSGYNYKIIHKNGTENVSADCFSRAPVTRTGNCINSIDQEVHQLCIASINQICSRRLNFKTIQEETQKDETLFKILSNLRHSTANDSELTIDSNVLFKGQRVVIPSSLQNYVLQELHHTHTGTTKMKQLARRYVYWSAIDKDIEKFVRACQACASTKSSPAKAPLHPWEEPDYNWQRIHIDYAGPFQGHYFLMVVDAKSKWIEVGICSTAPSSMSTIEILLNIFTRNGYPDVMVSDNATIFKSEEFSTFCQDCGIFQKFIAPGHPATNGLAERNIQTLKHKLAAMSNEVSSMQKKVRDIIFKYRTTPLRSGKTPSELYLGRQIRSRLDVLQPPKIQNNNYDHIPSRQLCVGERVQARYYTPNKPLWKFGTIIKKIGRLHYIVKLDNGYVFKRHINQLLSTNVQTSGLTSIQPSPEQTNEENSNHKQPGQQVVFQQGTIDNPGNVNNRNGVFEEESSANRSTAPPSGHEPSSSTGLDPAPVQNQSSNRASSRQRRTPRYLEEYVLN